MDSFPMEVAQTGRSMCTLCSLPHSIRTWRWFAKFGSPFPPLYMKSGDFSRRWKSWERFAKDCAMWQMQLVTMLDCIRSFPNSSQEPVFAKMCGAEVEGTTNEVDLSMLQFEPILNCKQHIEMKDIKVWFRLFSLWYVCTPFGWMQQDWYKSEAQSELELVSLNIMGYRVVCVDWKVCL